MISPKKAIGSHSSRSLWIRSQLKPKASTAGPIGSRGPGLKRREHAVDGRELDAALAPGGRAGGDAGVVEPARGVLDEEDAPAALEETLDRRVVAHICCDAE